MKCCCYELYHKYTWKNGSEWTTSNSRNQKYSVPLGWQSRRQYLDADNWLRVMLLRICISSDLSTCIHPVINSTVAYNSWLYAHVQMQFLFDFESFMSRYCSLCIWMPLDFGSYTPIWATVHWMFSQQICWFIVLVGSTNSSTVFEVDERLLCIYANY